VVRRGVYAPLTLSGDILVSGIVASDYVDLLELPMMPLLWDQHTLAHVLFGPQRIFCYYWIDTCQLEIYLNGYGPLAYCIVEFSNFIKTYSRRIFDASLMYYLPF
jgi:Hint module